MRVNIGCGQTPTPGWDNFDNSLSVRLARLPSGWISALVKLSIIDQGQADFMAFCRSCNIGYADARALPFRDGQVDVLYSSHMLEHLDRDAAVQFLHEAGRVLRPGGIMRLAVPDLEAMILNYMKDRDGDAFLTQTLLTRTDVRSWKSRLLFLLAGDRGHKHLYDARSLCTFLSEHGFRHPRPMLPGETTIPDPGDLDLREREAESLYVEATTPAVREV
ncbi:MAG: methyltransferase domain-containing protein [Magnetococcales bacterium]|nr:methyltransferase domain-containing protein [Magnetococcales bacterium]MBF0322166.1 methyltransferase domain-containing protein [Magnetococcales bacterium]